MDCSCCFGAKPLSRETPPQSEIHSQIVTTQPIGQTSRNAQISREGSEHIMYLHNFGHHSKSPCGVVLEDYDIPDRATGFGYKRVFGPYFDETVHNLVIEEPYLRFKYQRWNLITICELAANNCPNLKFVLLKTVDDEQSKIERELAFTTIRQVKFLFRNIRFLVEYHNFHDRVLRINDTIKIAVGYGLHYFYPLTNKLPRLAHHNNELRECKPTNVTVKRMI